MENLLSELVSRSPFKFFQSHENLQLEDLDQQFKNSRRERSDLQVIRDIYCGKEDLRAISRSLAQELEETYREIDEFTDSWLSQARSLLKFPSENLMHCIVTSGQLIPSIAKIIVYKLNTFVPISFVFSSRTVGKRSCFRRIKEIYKDNKIFIVGNGIEEESSSKSENFPFWKISSFQDLRELHSRMSQNLDSLFK